MKLLGKNSLSSILWIIVNVMWFLQWFGAIVLLVTITMAATNMNEPLMVSLPVLLDPGNISQLPSVSGEEGQIAGLSLGEVKARISFSSANFLYLFISHGIGLLVVIYSLYITYLIRKIVLSLTKGSPFIMENAVILRRVAIVIIAAAPLKYIAEWAIMAWEKANFEVIGANFDATVVDFNFDLFFLGFLVLIISEVFTIGTALQEEQSLTV